MIVKIEMARCKKGLGKLWLFGGGFIFLILLGQTIFGHYEEQAEEAWHWFLPTVIPTLSLIVSAWVIEAKGKAVEQKPVSKRIYRGTWGLSAFYLFVILLSIIAQPYVSMLAVEWLNQSNLWLGPLQGLVVTATGIFFLKK
jgi:hypothetical protein